MQHILVEISMYPRLSELIVISDVLIYLKHSELLVTSDINYNLTKKIMDCWLSIVYTYHEQSDCWLPVV